MLIQPLFAQSAPFALAATVIVGLVLFICAVIVLNFGMIYIRAQFSGAKVTFTELIALKLRSVPVSLIVDTRITAVKSGIPITIDDLSSHYLAGGNVEAVVQALIAAKKALMEKPELAKKIVAAILEKRAAAPATES